MFSFKISNIAFVRSKILQVNYYIIKLFTMKSIILKVIFIVSVTFFWIINTQITNSYFSVGWEHTISEYQRSIIKANITKKILEKNNQLKNESNYVELPTYNSHFWNTSYSNNNWYSFNNSYVIVKPIQYKRKFSFQKNKRFHSFNVSKSCKNIKTTYSLKKSYLTAELNRLIINKESWYSLYEERSQYYNYFLTYSNNYHVGGRNDSREIINWYVNNLIERNFDNLDKIDSIVDSDIIKIKDRLSFCYDNLNNLSNTDLLKKNLKTLYRIQDKIEWDRIILKKFHIYHNR